ncbi:predicted protein [Coccidioides posadasii str. Silveira]|uniref:Predicted protein n=1 Tax=Coccidioides posadasii (strain RMSCC 757 / Silveira) TaxID=443226 RepID=E9D4E0_COCPS|nr:predicted protein [Coccidioides posadasii str. Silveira]
MLNGGINSPNTQHVHVPNPSPLLRALCEDPLDALRRREEIDRDDRTDRGFDPDDIDWTEF